MNFTNVLLNKNLSYKKFNILTTGYRLLNIEISSKVIDKATISFNNAGEPISNHFFGINKIVDIGSGAQRPLSDIALTRYACY